MKYQLKEICSITKGATGIMKAIPGKYPLVALSDTRRSHNEFQFDANAVIVPLISSTGHGHASMKRVHYQEGKFALGNILCAVIPTDETQLNAKYLHLYLQQFKETLLVPLMKGAANVSLPMNKLADVKIEVPGLERQLEIIALEDKAAELKNELEEKFFLQDGDVTKLRQALLREAMQGKLTKQNLKDGNTKDLLEKIKEEKRKLGIKEKPLAEIKEEEIPFEIPGNWAWCMIPQIAANKKHALKAGPFGSSLKKEFYVENGYKIYGQEQVINQDPFFGNYYINETKFQTLKSCQVTSGDILISLVGTMGKVLILPDGIEDGIINPRLVKVSLYPSLNREFIRWFLYSPIAIEQIEHYSHGSTMDIINLGIITKLLIPLPPLPEQNRIVKKLEELMKLCDELQAGIQASKTENEKLLQGALRDALKNEELVTA